MILRVALFFLLGLLAASACYTGSCPDGESCCNGDYCCSATQLCCTDTLVGYCCNEGLSCCGGVCCNATTTTCCSASASYGSSTCCTEGATCCDGTCCSSSQLCMNTGIYSTGSTCCNANVTFYVSGCATDTDCGTDASCCYGCCCPGNYSCDSSSKQCIWNPRDVQTTIGLEIGLGYGLSLGFVYAVLWCCMRKQNLASGWTPFLRRMLIFSWIQMVVTVGRIIMYGVYPYSIYFEQGVAACCTSFWLYFTGIILRKAKKQRAMMLYWLLFIINIILSMICLFGDWGNMVKKTEFYMLIALNLLNFIIDCIWILLIIVYFFIGKCCGSTTGVKKPLIAKKRNQRECFDLCKAKPTVRLLSEDDSAFLEIKQHFMDSWTKGTTTGVTIQYILKVKNPGIMSNYRSYKTKIARENAEEPNVKSLFHCTKLSTKCNIIRANDLCTHSDCSVCGITRRGFKITHSGLNIKFSRFGRGIYFAPNSSKANDYNSDTTRAMLYCKVVTGNQYVTEHDQNNLTAAPKSYHSVYGKPGARLNYPEVVVYHEHAVKPTHVIIYSVQ